MEITIVPFYLAADFIGEYFQNQCDKSESYSEYQNGEGHRQITGSHLLIQGLLCDHLMKK